jgi:hypothetical protein
MKYWKYAIAGAALAGAGALPTAFADEEYIINRRYSYPVRTYTEHRVYTRPVVREVRTYERPVYVRHVYDAPSVTVVRPGIRVECDDDGECEVDD